MGKVGIVVLFVVFAILSLGVASRGQAGMAYWGGLGFAVFCVLAAFYLTHRLTENHDNGNQH